MIRRLFSWETLSALGFVAIVLSMVAAVWLLFCTKPATGIDVVIPGLTIQSSDSGPRQMVFRFWNGGKITWHAGDPIAPKGAEAVK